MGRASFRTAQNALSTTAELVAAAMPGRRTIEVKNSDASISIYVGYTDGVTTATGHLLAAGHSFLWEDYDGPIYAIAASGTPTITLLEY
jgi:hypothetical protein